MQCKLWCVGLSRRRKLKRLTVFYLNWFWLLCHRMKYLNKFTDNLHGVTFSISQTSLSYFLFSYDKKWRLIKIFNFKLKHVMRLDCLYRTVYFYNAISSFFWPLNKSTTLWQKIMKIIYASCCCRKFLAWSHSISSLLPSFLVTDRLRNINMVMKTSRLWKKKKKTSHALRFKRSKKLILLLSTDLLHDF